MRALLVIIFLLVFLLNSQAQYNFKPLSTHLKNSEKIKKNLKAGLLTEINQISVDTLALLRDNYEKSLSSIYKAIDKEKFIWSDTLTALVERVLNKLLVSNRVRTLFPIVLIANTPEANAICLPSGTIIVTIGLLGRITTEEQLAFVLAHELEHHHLKHVRARMYIQQKSKSEKKLESTVKDILNGGEPIEEIEELKELFYETAEFSRKKELEADSAAIKLMESVHYNTNGAIDVLSLLELGLCSDSLSNDKLFEPLNSPKFPFRKVWISRDFQPEERFSPLFFFSKDSLKSHPETEFRQKEIRRQIHETSTSTSVDSITKIARFQIVKSAYDEQFLDVALYQALSLAYLYGMSDYLIEYIGKTLALTAQLKKNPLTNRYFYKSTYGFCHSLQQTSNLLRTIDAQEIGEILFQFMNQSKIFDPDNELHYWLIWQACNLTPRITTGDKIRTQYLQKFPNGQYKKRMK